MVHDLMKNIIGQQNMLSLFFVGIPEAAFRKVDINAAGAFPFLPFFNFSKIL